MRKILLPLFMILCLVLPFPVHAAETGVSVSLPVEQKVNVLHEKPANQTFGYVFTSLDETNPMPSKEKEYQFRLTGNESKLLDAITFVHAGVYSYELKIIEPEKVDGYTYDTRTYRIDVYVKNTANGGLDPLVIVQHKDGKCGSITYEHVYDKKVDPEKEDGTNTSTQTNSMQYVFMMLCAFFGFLLLFLCRNKEEKSE